MKTLNKSHNGGVFVTVFCCERSFRNILRLFKSRNMSFENIYESLTKISLFFESIFNDHLK